MLKDEGMYGRIVSEDCVVGLRDVEMYICLQ